MQPIAKFCVFCGKPPEDKNREHVLPQWLLELTGDPKRVVTMCFDYSRDKKPIRFDWSSLVMPACTKCNGDYSKLEDEAKWVLASLLQRESLSASSYCVLLDWLDKVRVGCWLNFRQLERYPLQIAPNFYINSRIGVKDRMVAVYTFDSEMKGLNSIGTDSMIFRQMPSCFGLRVNDILLLNASADYLCSQNCGFPFPGKMELLTTGPHQGMTSMSDFEITRKTKHPLLEFALIKPTVMLYQPVMMPSSDPRWQGGFLGDYCSHDSFLARHRLPDDTGQGILFRQWSDRVEPIHDMLTPIVFDEVNGDDCKTFGEVAAQTYDLQLYLYDRVVQNLSNGDKHSREGRVSLQIEELKMKSARDFAELYRSAGVNTGGS